MKKFVSYGEYKLILESVNWYSDYLRHKIKKKTTREKYLEKYNSVTELQRKFAGEILFRE